MLGAIPFDTLAFIALVIIASFFRWISKEAEKAKRKSGQTEESPAKPARVQRPAETDEERVRRFLKALGQPTSAKPPARAQRRTMTPRRETAPRGRSTLSPLPPLTTVPPDLPPSVTPAQQITEPPALPKTFTPEVSTAPIFEVREHAIAMETTPLVRTPSEAHAIATRAVVNKEQPSSFAILLSSTSGLRDAVILREIFGPPRSLQTLEF